MRISPINTTYYNNFIRQGSNKKIIYSDNKSFSFSSSSLVQKTDIDIKKLQEDIFFEEFLNKKGKVTKEEYENIAKNHPEIISEAQEYLKKYTGKLTPENLAKTAIAIDKYLKEHYENYRIISVGTSPDVLAQQLEILGSEVIYVPISGLDGFDSEFDKVENMPELCTVLDYINFKNIDDGKKNIVIDYTITGYTLKILCDLIKKHCSGNVEMVSLQKLINKADKSKNTLFGFKKEKSPYIQDAWWGLIEEISSVPHFPVILKDKPFYKDIPNTVFIDDKRKEEMFEKFENSASPLSRAFALCTMAEIDKLKKDNK